MNWKFEKLSLSGAYKITPFYSPDIRGEFCKDYSKTIFEQNGINYNLSEVFYTYSHKGVVRALHFQRKIQQPKLVRCIKGHVYDVIVDLRKNSKTFKQWIGFNLTQDNHLEILVPSGFAHGYLVLEESIVSYKCSEKFYENYDDGIKWDDPNLGIKWPINQIGGKDKIILSEKDKKLSSFQDFMKNYGDFLG